MLTTSTKLGPELMTFVENFRRGRSMSQYNFFSIDILVRNSATVSAKTDTIFHMGVYQGTWFFENNSEDSRIKSTWKREIVLSTFPPRQNY